MQFTVKTAKRSGVWKSPSMYASDTGMVRSYCQFSFADIFNSRIPTAQVVSEQYFQPKIIVGDDECSCRLSRRSLPKVKFFVSFDN